MLFFTFLFFFNYILGSTQDINISFKVNYGFILPHHKSIEYIVNENVTGYDLLIGKIYGEILPNKLKKAPEIGLGFYFGNLGNDKHYGKVFALYPYISTVFIKKNRHSFTGTFGGGLGYLTKRFDLLNNFKNVAISTHLNAFFNISVNYEYELNNKLTFLTGLGLKHTSNGSLKKPNLGLNAITMNIGLKHLITKKSVENKLCEKFYKKKDFTNQNHIIFGINGGVHRTTNLDENLYFKGNITISYIKPVRERWFWGAGTDFFYDYAADRSRWTTEPRTDFKYRFTSGIHSSIGVYIKDFDLYFSTGIYVYNKLKEDKNIYTRLGIRYHFSNKWNINLGLKSHLFNADLIELGFSYTLPIYKTKKYK